jgi:hypothetical protein
MWTCQRLCHCSVPRTHSGPRGEAVVAMVAVERQWWRWRQWWQWCRGVAVVAVSVARAGQVLYFKREHDGEGALPSLHDLQPVRAAPPRCALLSSLHCAAVHAAASAPRPNNAAPLPRHCRHRVCRVRGSHRTACSAPQRYADVDDAQRRAPTAFQAQPLRPGPSTSAGSVITAPSSRPHTTPQINAAAAASIAGKALRAAAKIVARWLISGCRLSCARHGRALHRRRTGLSPVRDTTAAP